MNQEEEEFEEPDENTDWYKLPKGVKWSASISGFEVKTSTYLRMKKCFRKILNL